MLLSISEASTHCTVQTTAGNDSVSPAPDGFCYSGDSKKPFSEGNNSSLQLLDESRFDVKLQLWALRIPREHCVTVSRLLSGSVNPPNLCISTFFILSNWPHLGWCGWVFSGSWNGRMIKLRSVHGIYQDYRVQIMSVILAM